MSKLNILFFANLREQLKCNELSLDFVEAEAVSGLICRLVDTKGEAFELLNADSVKVAVNSELCNLTTELKPGDEVAFFPPVTGG